jgi:hypothetical protein
MKHQVYTMLAGTKFESQHLTIYALDIETANFYAECWLLDLNLSFRRWKYGMKSSYTNLRRVREGEFSCDLHNEWCEKIPFRKKDLDEVQRVSGFTFPEQVSSKQELHQEYLDAFKKDPMTALEDDDVNDLPF